MTRAGAIIMFLFILNLTFNLLNGVGIPTGTATPYISNSVAESMTASSVWRTSDVIGLGTALGYLFAMGVFIITAVLFLISVVIQMTVGAPAFYESLFRIVVGTSVATTMFSLFLGLIQQFIILFFMYEQYKGGDTNT